MRDTHTLSSRVCLNKPELKGKNQTISHIYAKCHCTVFVLYLGSTQVGSEVQAASILNLSLLWAFLVPSREMAECNTRLSQD